MAARAYFLAALLHEPLGGGGGAADAEGGNATEHMRSDVLRPLHEIAAGVDAEAGIEEHTTVAALLAADKDDGVMARGKLNHAGDAVAHLTADSVERLKGGGRLDMVADETDNLLKLGQRLGGLREEAYGTAEIEARGILGAGEHYGVALGLPHQAKHLGMAGLAVDDYLCLGVSLILAAYAALQLQHHGACSIDNLYVVGTGDGIGGRGLAVSTEQHLAIAEGKHLLMVDRLQAERPEAFTLHAVVNNIAKAVERRRRAGLKSWRRIGIQFFIIQFL